MAQSHAPGDPVWRMPNHYDSGGSTLTPEGPQWDYGVPKFAPIPQQGMMPYFVPVPVRPRGQTVEELVRETTARMKAQAYATCLEVVRLQEFLASLGVEATKGEGCVRP